MGQEKKIIISKMLLKINKVFKKNCYNRIKRD